MLSGYDKKKNHLIFATFEWGMQRKAPPPPDSTMIARNLGLTDNSKINEFNLFFNFAIGTSVIHFLGK